jgi:hypothetical protein
MGVDELFDLCCGGLALVEARIEPHNSDLCCVYLSLDILARATLLLASTSSLTLAASWQVNIMTLSISLILIVFFQSDKSA